MVYFQDIGINIYLILILSKYIETWNFYLEIMSAINLKIFRDSFSRYWNDFFFQYMFVIFSNYNMYFNGIFNSEYVFQCGYMYISIWEKISDRMSEIFRGTNIK